MKKSYITPVAEKITFHYTQQVVASGCYWKNNGFWSYSTSACRDSYVEGTSTQVPA